MDKQNPDVKICLRHSVSESNGWDQVCWESELEVLAVSQQRGHERATEAVETRVRKTLELRQ